MARSDRVWRVHDWSQRPRNKPTRHAGRYDLNSGHGYSLMIQLRAMHPTLAGIALSGYRQLTGRENAPT